MSGNPPEPQTPGVEQLEALLGPLNETSTLRLSADGRPMSGLRLFAQRALFRVLRPLWFQQHQFHAHLVAALHTTAGALRSERRAREAVDARVRSLTGRLLATRREADRLARSIELMEHARDAAGTLNPSAATEALSTALAELQSASSTFHQHASEHLRALTTAVQGTETELAALSHKLFAPPYMSDPSRFIVKDAQGRDQLGYRTAATNDEGFYRAFEDVFRGPESLVRDRQTAYLPLLAHRAGVVDLGCGRGEMLDLLKEAGVAARGVDIDQDMVRRCQSKGHDVEAKDVLDFLREQPPQSLPALFSAQVIEHLTFPQLKELLELSATRLRPGGVLIAETVNPHALEAFKTFYTDLTHQRPIFPEVALVLSQLAGFAEAFIMFPLGTGKLEVDRPSRGEFALVATAPASPPAAPAQSSR
jgi:2-polyprenyl-3-methyl-5-hydroxy-6-metoxy-1,4-benzoquinol methylase